MAQLGLNLAFYTGDPYADLLHLGLQAEEAGYDCLMVPEGIAGNDALLCCYMLATATSRIHIVPNVANIYLRDPSLCAVTSATIQQASQGRFMLGIGVSHRPVLEAMGIEMGNARARLRDYTLALAQGLHRRDGEKVWRALSPCGATGAHLFRSGDAGNRADGG